MKILGKFIHDRLGIHYCERTPAFIIGEERTYGGQWEAVRKYEYRCTRCGETFRTSVNCGAHTTFRGEGKKPYDAE